MNEITLHPDVYSTGNSKNLIHILERIWIGDHTPGDGTIFIVSGFANYNGGVRFFETFRQHCKKGGNVIAVFAGSASSRLTSKQIVEGMLQCGAEVHIIKRNRLMHAKCYGSSSTSGEALVVTSGNFTAPGMSQNVEMSVSLDTKSTASIKFSWQKMVDNILEQNWSFYQPKLAAMDAPPWKLLYDEQATDIELDSTNEVTMILKLGHADTVRINAVKGSSAAKGTQYFWLSKDCYDFFPPLTTRNIRGKKATYSCEVKMKYIDLGIDKICKVTFEAENNLDFRLGTGPLRYTGLANVGDLAAISRVDDARYELRVFNQNDEMHRILLPYVVHTIGHKGKCYGFMPNADFNTLVREHS